MDEAAMQQTLEQAQAARRSASLGKEQRDALFAKLHALAEEQYLPARAFFESCLTDLDAEWRLECITDLSHYDLPAESEVLERIRHVLVTDPDAAVRIWAVGILGAQRDAVDEWPEEALVTALDDDPVAQVRSSAFRALLETAGVPYAAIQQALARLEKGVIQPSWVEVERIGAEARINPQPHE